jgi:mRNA-degrading endonuclease RelE of RelBE toxin-antitoxin system
MAFLITLTREADAQLQALSAREQRPLKAAILARLRDRSTTPSRAIKRLRPKPLAEFELRIGDLRVLSNLWTSSESS